MKCSYYASFIVFPSPKPTGIRRLWILQKAITNMRNGSTSPLIFLSEISPKMSQGKMSRVNRKQVLSYFFCKPRDISFSNNVFIS